MDVKTRNELFDNLAHMQRGRPEDAMLAVQRLVPGVMSFAVEHCGDLIHRSTEHFAYSSGTFGRGYVLDKAEKVLRTLEHRYGFKKEFEENIEAAADYENKNVSEVRKKVYQALQVYADEHAKLPTYNDLHKAEQKACVALGRGRYKQAAQWLKWIIRLAKDRPRYERIAGSVTTMKKQNPKYFENEIPSQNIRTLLKEVRRHVARVFKIDIDTVKISADYEPGVSDTIATEVTWPYSSKVDYYGLLPQFKRTLRKVLADNYVHHPDLMDINVTATEEGPSKAMVLHLYFTKHDLGLDYEQNPRHFKNDRMRLEKWFERDRAHVALVNDITGETVVEWWDEDVHQAIEDGILNPKDFMKSAMAYAREHKLIWDEYRPGSRSEENPRMMKGVKVMPSIYKEFIDENVIDWKLPDDPPTKRQLFPSWEKGTHQMNFYESKEARDEAARNQQTFLWPPRSMYKGRILFGLRPVIEMLDRSPDKSTVGALQYIVHPDRLEVIFMATRKGWKRLGIMSILIEAAKERHKREIVEYWEPTKAGEKFIKGKQK